MSTVADSKQEPKIEKKEIEEEEFEEFPIQEWTERQEGEDEVSVWEDNWDDETHESEFSKQLKNIGIIAHVDAGKTTVTERLLYLAGAISVAGNVDKGNTVTDFLDIERERGITVQSAAVNLDWKHHRINLIDTPGHVDFRVEVERCVRVLDGIVCIIDGSAGVQPQTLTVWHQASKFQLPAIFFINKLDKKEGNFANSLDSIQQKLGIKAIPTVIPLSNQEFSGIIDIIGKRFLKIGDVDEQWKHIEQKSAEYEKWEEARSELCYGIADNDEMFMAEFLDSFNGDHSKVDDKTINAALRNLTLSNKIATVSCGSAVKSLHCVQPILDGVNEYFPSPDLRNTQYQQIFGANLSGLVFKITHDKRRGQLSYVRVYTGKLQNNSTIFNANQMSSEGPIKLFTPYADELQPADFVEHGNIAVVSGLSNTITGDTILLSRDSAEMAFKNLKQLNIDTQTISGKTSIDGAAVLFSGIESPESVYFCCIEPPSMKHQNVFNRALDEMTREDPSMKVRFDKDTGQTIIETQGELHLEAIKDRLLRGYKLDVFIGKLQVAYKEMITQTVNHTCTFEDKMSEKKRPETVTLSLRIEPTNEKTAFKRVELDLPSDARPIRPDWQRAINEGCANALQNGPLASYPVHAVKIFVTELVVSGGKINPALLSACAQKCLNEAISIAGVIFTEPVMDVEVNVSSEVPTQPILSEFVKRRAKINFTDRINDNTVRICAQMPLAEMENLSRVIRTLSSGLSDMNMQVSGYQEVPEFERNSILQKRMGYE
ncbi:unnamed protein product [Caenorhabditis bovis]|uniref:Tr-type G domain-containing protein n=1 Tax=Caenorhabditis bovis TaxID=2654633 RepID=A0A8S1EM21_9PELO|nr:unnamed protein product [Caenorhabditis bovis]